MVRNQAAGCILVKHFVGPQSAIPAAALWGLSQTRTGWSGAAAAAAAAAVGWRCWWQPALFLSNFVSFFLQALLSSPAPAGSKKPRLVFHWQLAPQGQAYISFAGYGQALAWQFDLRNRKLQAVSQTATEVQEHIPEVTEHPRDYNTSTERERVPSGSPVHIFFLAFGSSLSGGVAVILYLDFPHLIRWRQR